MRTISCHSPHVLEPEVETLILASNQRRISIMGRWGHGPTREEKNISTLLNYSGRPTHYSTASFALPLPC
jgi:hypothetical protein